jgi:hypothetical protein
MAITKNARTGKTHLLKSSRNRRAAYDLMPDFPAILRRYLDARALVTVASRSLEQQEGGNSSPESTVLRAGVAALDRVYNEVDAATIHFRMTDG